MQALSQLWGLLGIKRRKHDMTIFLRAVSDEAGNDQDHDYVVAAGCVGLDENWEIIEQKWEAVLRRSKVNLFHAVDFHNNKGEFKDWGKLKRERFYKALSKIVKESPIISMAVAVNKKEHKDIKEEMKGIRNFSSSSDYGLAFRLFRYWTCHKVHELNPDAKIAYVVESGPYSGGVESIYNELVATVGAKYRPAKYAEMMDGFHSIPKGKLRGLEVADFLADRALKDLETGRFINPGRSEQVSFLADPEFLRDWHKDMLAEKEKRKNHGANPTKKIPA